MNPFHWFVQITIPARTINWIDRQTSNLEVAGSSPAAPATPTVCFFSKD
jgi:hypothetical protein